MKVIKYLKNYLYYLKSRRNNESRICQICLGLTDACNSRCTQCDIWRSYLNDPSKKDKEFKVWEIERMLKSSPSLRYLTSVSLTGGEPALREDLVEIAKVLKDNNKEIRLFFQSNGLSTERVVQKIKEVAAFADVTACISVDGLEATHDRVRGVPGGYQRALTTIKRLQEENIDINLSCNITPLNHKEIKQVWQLFRPLIDYFSCRPIATGAFFKSEDPNRFILNKEEIKEVRSQLKEIDYAKNLFIRQVDLILEKQRRLFPCGAGLFSLIITPDLSVYPCSACPSDWCFGNLREVDYNLDLLLESEKGKEIKKKVGHCLKYETEYCINEPEFYSTAHFQTFALLGWLLLKDPLTAIRSFLGAKSPVYRFVRGIRRLSHAG